MIRHDAQLRYTMKRKVSIMRAAGWLSFTFKVKIPPVPLTGR